MACDTCAALAPSRWNVAWLPSISTIEILTVIVQVAVFSPAVAVMVAVPSPMAVTIPSGDTVATASSEDVHVASPAPSGRTVPKVLRRYVSWILMMVLPERLWAALIMHWY